MNEPVVGRVVDTLLVKAGLPCYFSGIRSGKSEKKNFTKLEFKFENIFWRLLKLNKVDEKGKF